MSATIIEQKKSLWKRFEKFSGIIGLFVGIATLIGLYYQFQTKKNRIEFQILSKDYLTTNSNIDGLNSNYEYGGIPVKNLWLLKFKIVNTGDATLLGVGNNKSILDSTIIFKFQNNLQILDKLNLVQKEFPDHILKIIDSTGLSLTFEQWRKDEFAIYSIYVKSNNKNISLLPESRRVIKDGDILVVDLTENSKAIKQPLLDKWLSYPTTLIGRICGITFALLFFILINLIIYIESQGWIKTLRWKRKYSSQFSEFIYSEELLNDETIFPNASLKSDFILKRKKYLQDPSILYNNNKIWEKFKGKKIPKNDGVKTWYGFFTWLLVWILCELSVSAIILGLIID